MLFTLSTEYLFYFIRIGAKAEIDFHDCAIVQTIEFTAAGANSELPQPMSAQEVENMTLALKTNDGDGHGEHCGGCWSSQGAASSCGSGDCSLKQQAGDGFRDEDLTNSAYVTSQLLLSRLKCCRSRFRVYEASLWPKKFTA